MAIVNAIEEQLDLFSFLECGAADACKKLATAVTGSAAIPAEVRNKFYKAVVDVEAVTIRTLASTNGAFVIEGSTMLVSEEPVAKLLTVILNEVAQDLEGNEPSLSESEIPLLLEKVFIQYVFHELRHRSQGLAGLANVRILRDVAGPHVMSEYDVMADRDAALAVASIYAEDETRASFLRAFREALFFSTKYFFQVFPIPQDRPDKIARAMAILFMAARLAKKDLLGSVEENEDRPLDASLYVTLSTQNKKLAIHRGEPSRELLGFADNDDGVGDLIDQICDGNFGSAMETSIKILDLLDLIE